MNDIRNFEEETFFFIFFFSSRQKPAVITPFYYKMKSKILKTKAKKKNVIRSIEQPIFNRKMILPSGIDRFKLFGAISRRLRIS